jgi:hypothetical protein
MIVIKSDGRHNFYELGFTTILEFKFKVARERDLMIKMIDQLTQLHGPYRWINEGGNKRYNVNEHYRIQLMSDRKRRRIYLKDESTVSYLLLTAN